MPIKSLGSPRVPPTIWSLPLFNPFHVSSTYCFNGIPTGPFSSAVRVYTVRKVCSTGLEHGTLLCTRGGDTSITLTVLSFNCFLRQRMKAFSAALEAEYAGMELRGAMERREVVLHEQLA